MRRSTRQADFPQLRSRARWRQRGNALMEYAVPASLLLLTAGVMSSALNVNGSIAGYFLAASGHSQSALSGGVFKTIALEEPGVGSTGNGQEGFTTFATLLDGNDQPLPVAGAGIFYTVPVIRGGGRPASLSPEYLYP